MNHIIGKAPEKAEPSADTAVLKAVDEQEEAKKETSEATSPPSQKRKAEEEISSKGQRRGTILRIGAFLTAAICFLAGVRAIRNPGTTAGTLWQGISNLTVRTDEEDNASVEKLHTISGDVPIQTTTDSEYNVSQTETADIQGTAASDASTQEAVTTAAVGSEDGQMTPISKNRTQEELAEAFAAIPLSNEAKLTYDAETLSTLIPAFQLTDRNEPLVLIMHTHGSEGYVNTDGHSQDTKQNVVAVGDALEETLLELGIPVLHDERMYDIPSYTRAYNEAYQGIQDILERNPSIQIVMDIHRDAYTYDNGSLLRTTDALTDANGETIRTSRVMFLVGTNAGTLEHPTWRSHLAFAMALQTRMEDIVPGITRSVFLRRQRFNEHMTPGSLLVEIGSSGDTLEEAKTAVRIFGRALAEQILAGEA